jgi:hypothetical protein
MADYASGTLRFEKDGSISGHLYLDLRESVRRLEKCQQRALIVARLAGWLHVRLSPYQTEILASLPDLVAVSVQTMLIRLLDKTRRMMLSQSRVTGRRCALALALLFFLGNEGRANESYLGVIEHIRETLRPRIALYVPRPNLETYAEYHLSTFNSGDFLLAEQYRRDWCAVHYLTLFERGTNIRCEDTGFFSKCQSAGRTGTYSDNNFVEKSSTGSFVLNVITNVGGSTGLVGVVQLNSINPYNGPQDCQQTVFGDICGSLSSDNRRFHIAGLENGGNKQADCSETQDYRCEKKPFCKESKLAGIIRQLRITFGLPAPILSFLSAFGFCFFGWCYIYNNRLLLGPALLFVAFLLGNLGGWLLDTRLILF